MAKKIYEYRYKAAWIGFIIKWHLSLLTNSTQLLLKTLTNWNYPTFPQYDFNFPMSVLGQANKLQQIAFHFSSFWLLQKTWTSEQCCVHLCGFITPPWQNPSPTLPHSLTKQHFLQPHRHGWRSLCTHRIADEKTSSSTCCTRGTFSSLCGRNWAASFSWMEKSRAAGYKCSSIGATGKQTSRVFG